MPWGARKAGYLGIAAILAKGVTKRYNFRRDFSPIFFWALHVTGQFRRDFSRIFFLGYTLQHFRRIVRRNPDRHYVLRRSDRETTVESVHTMRW